MPRHLTERERAFLDRFHDLHLALGTARREGLSQEVQAVSRWVSKPDNGANFRCSAPASGFSLRLSRGFRKLSDFKTSEGQAACRAWFTLAVLPADGRDLTAASRGHRWLPERAQPEPRKPDSDEDSRCRPGCPPSSVHGIDRLRGAGAAKAGADRSRAETRARAASTLWRCHGPGGGDGGGREHRFRQGRLRVPGGGSRRSGLGRRRGAGGAEPLRRTGGCGVVRAALRVVVRASFGDLGRGGTFARRNSEHHPDLEGIGAAEEFAVGLEDFAVAAAAAEVLLSDAAEGVARPDRVGDFDRNLFLNRVDALVNGVRGHVAGRSPFPIERKRPGDHGRGVGVSRRSGRGSRIDRSGDDGWDGSDFVRMPGGGVDPDVAEREMLSKAIGVRIGHSGAGRQAGVPGKAECSRESYDQDSQRKTEFSVTVHGNGAKGETPSTISPQEARTELIPRSRGGKRKTSLELFETAAAGRIDFRQRLLGKLFRL